MPPPANLPALASRLRGHVAALASSPRVPGSPEHRRAAAYVADHLRRCGFAVERAAFTEAGIEGVNLFTTPVPAADGPPPLVLVGAHYDSIPGSPGADDNASAV